MTLPVFPAALVAVVVGSSMGFIEVPPADGLAAASVRADGLTAVPVRADGLTAASVRADRADMPAAVSRRAGCGVMTSSNGSVSSADRAVTPQAKAHASSMDKNKI